MTGEWAAHNYEPTPEEVQDTFALIVDEASDGAHGFIDLIPTMERYIWGFDIWWSDRQVLPDGHVRLHWLTPGRDCFTHD